MREAAAPLYLTHYKSCFGLKSAITSIVEHIRYSLKVKVKLLSALRPGRFYGVNRIIVHVNQKK